MGSFLYVHIVIKLGGGLKMRQSRHPRSLLNIMDSYRKTVLLLVNVFNVVLKEEN